MFTKAARAKLRRVYAYFNDFMEHEDKDQHIGWKIAGVILCITAAAAIFMAANVLFQAIITSLMAKNIPMFLAYTGALTGSMLASLGLSSYGNYLSGKIAFRWRKYLTNKLYEETTGEKYLDLNRSLNKPQGIEAIIQRSTTEFTSSAVKLAADFVRNTLFLVGSGAALWMYGGGLPLLVMGTPVFIPGYMVMAALILASVSWFQTRRMGSSLLEMNKQKQSVEASLRGKIGKLFTDSENIALSKAKNYHKQDVAEDLSTVIKNSTSMNSTNNAVNTFNDAINSSGTIIATILCAPLYVMGQITFGAISQVTFLFTEFLKDLNWFSTSYAKINECQAHMDRIEELNDALALVASEKEHQKIVLKICKRSSIHLDLENIKVPDGSRILMKNLDLTFREGEHTIITAKSGLGKSTIFKAIVDCWSYGEGTIELPKDKTIMCLPQFASTLDSATLLENLAYPQDISEIQDHEDFRKRCAVVLAQVDLTGKIAQLDQPLSQVGKLSGGERNKLGIARALLRAPDYLLLDEATASLDNAGEEAMYDLLKEELPGTTLISISHKERVRGFHDRVVNITVDSEKNASLNETYKKLESSKFQKLAAEKSKPNQKTASGLATVIPLSIFSRKAPIKNPEVTPKGTIQVSPRAGSH